MTGSLSDLRPAKASPAARLLHITWGLLILVTIVALSGIVMLYSAADGNIQPWAAKQTIRFAIALIPMRAATFLSIHHLFRLAYWVYLTVLLLLIAVTFRGFVGMGAQRWINLGFIELQPSQLMTVALMLSLSRYFHEFDDKDPKVISLILPTLMILVPVGMVLKQPDLGTAMMLLLGGAVMFFLSGVRLRFFVLMIAATTASVPIAWQFLRDYQKSRIYTFLNPANDPLGAGYHILQSKIALGSGGLLGKGFLLGTQSHLSFLPEKQTDFIFTTLAEEFGLIGALAVISLYCGIIVYGFVIALRSRSQFGRLLSLGIVTNIFFYVFINIAMVMGLIPVVGVPLPLISYGGTAMLTAMFGFGLLMSVSIDHDVRLNRAGEPQPD
ncbi:MAG: rod shape-determining protein RodA [Stellaceae bacterium]